MQNNSKFHKIIGIAGASRSGKDTLCRSLIRILNEKYNVEAERRSIAGDLIKKNLRSIIINSVGIDSFTENTEEKELIRPLLVEYGKLMRNNTKARYFVENFEVVKEKTLIIPDIRYAEYLKDEIHWIKNEVDGYLIFLERENIKDANETEKINNKKLKILSNCCIRWGKLDENNKSDRKIIDDYSIKILNDIFQSTTSQ
jgi:ABC-type dipeptide/oligopeptide/nickel transport system ATPase component